MTRRTQYSIASLSGLKHLLNMPTCFLYWILVNSESIGFDIIISSICHQNSEFQRKAKFWLCWNIVESRIACSKWVLNFFFFCHTFGEEVCVCCVVVVVVIFIMAVFQLNCSLGLWSFSLNTSWWIEVTLEIRKKKLDCSLFGFKDYWWLSSTPLFQPSSASSPLFYNSYLLLQKRHLPLPHRKFVLISILFLALSLLPFFLLGLLRHSDLSSSLYEGTVE